MRMKRELPMPVVIGIVVIVLCAIVGGGWFWMNSRGNPKPPSGPGGPAPNGGQQMVNPEV
jgi:hypothetical protein